MCDVRYTTMYDGVAIDMFCMDRKWFWQVILLNRYVISI